jgi:hypothetical protein
MNQLADMHELAREAMWWLHILRSLRAGIPLVLLTGGVACNTVCSLVGCVNFLTVTFDTPPAVAYHVEAVSGSLGVRDFDCADPAKCGTASFANYTPDQVSITVTTARGSRQYNLTPAYQNTHVDGGCGVPCRNATVTLSLP